MGKHIETGEFKNKQLRAPKMILFGLEKK